ncbi:MAG: endonuclease MutS2 [Cyanobacteriota bacterium]|nr:endonuclease MutS2 [Cyanobacteriota bacterium]
MTNNKPQIETLELLEWARLCQHLSTFAATKLGARAARQLNPFVGRSQCGEWLAQTREAYTLELRLDRGLSFEGIQDIGDALERARRGGLLSGRELLEIATTLSGTRRLRRTLDAQEDIPALAALAAPVRTYPELEQDIHRCIDDRGRVQDRASAKLAGIRTQMKATRDRIYETLQRILQRHGNAIQEQVITQRGDRFVIPVKAPQKDAIPGAVRDSSSTGATLYIEPNAIVPQGNQLQQLQRQEKREEEIILAQLTEQVATVTEDLEELLAIVTTLDLATAKARYSLWLEANPPRFIDWGDGTSTALTSTTLSTGEIEKTETNGEVRTTENPIVLRQLRHPLLIWQQKHEQGKEVVPVDIQIRPEIRVVAITGPNTGGKTVTLKTLGLAALMAKAGLFVPAKVPVELPWFDQVLADIGDEQSLEQSLSTFSGHIRRISRIIDAINSQSSQSSDRFNLAPREEEPDEGELLNTLQDLPLEPEQKDEGEDNETSQISLSNALILLDEVGAGTDPAEGSALAIALLQYLANHALLTMASTHYGELKALKYQDSRFENASVEFDEQSLQPTYRLLWGIPGRSNALLVARRLGLDGGIIEEAQQRVGGASEEIDRTIAGLEKQRRNQELRAKEAEQLLQQTEQFYREVSQKAAELKERERELKRSQEQATNEAIAQARAEIAKVIRQLQQGPQTGQRAREATEAIAEIARKHSPEPQPKSAKPSYLPEIGERVRVPRLGQTAEVLEVAESAGEVTVRFGVMKMTVPLLDIESLDGQKVEPPKQKAPPPPPKATPKIVSTVRTSQNTLDIRGSRVAEAETEIERAIAKAVAAGSGVLWVLHGKGTGRLRQGVHEFLQRHPQVERFELAPQNEGGAGVTLAYLI